MWHFIPQEKNRKCETSSDFRIEEHSIILNSYTNNFEKMTVFMQFSDQKWFLERTVQFQSNLLKLWWTIKCVLPVSDSFKHKMRN